MLACTQQCCYHMAISHTSAALHASSYDQRHTVHGIAEHNAHHHKHDYRDTRLQNIHVCLSQGTRVCTSCVDQMDPSRAITHINHACSIFYSSVSMLKCCRVCQATCSMPITGLAVQPNKWRMSEPTCAAKEEPHCLACCTLFLRPLPPCMRYNSLFCTLALVLIIKVRCTIKQGRLCSQINQYEEILCRCMQIACCK